MTTIVVIAYYDCHCVSAQWLSSNADRTLSVHNNKNKLILVIIIIIIIITLLESEVNTESALSRYSIARINNEQTRTSQDVT